MSRYRITVRNSPGWRSHHAATLGVSVASPNWQGEKFAAILAWAATTFETIRIDVTDALYRHHFMAEGSPPQEAEARASALGTLWLAQHQATIDACPVPPQVIRWGIWYQHSEYLDTLAGFQRAYDLSPVLRGAVHSDITHFYQRKHHEPTRSELEHSTNYLLEELAVISLQARTLASVKIYPGDELACMHVVRHGLVPEAPRGLEREQFAKIKFVGRGHEAAAEETAAPLLPAPHRKGPAPRPALRLA